MARKGEVLTSNDLISSLWSSSSIDKCRIGLSDAVVCEGGLPARWYVTGGSGEVKLKRVVDLPSISRRWMAIADQSESTYVAAICQEGLVKFLTAAAWTAFVEETKVADPALLSIHCFLGRGTNPIIYRNSYTMNLATGRWHATTESYSIPKEEVMHIAYGDKLKLADSKATQICKVLDLATTTVVRYVERMLRIQITHCSIDYVIDKKSQIWMLWAGNTLFHRGESRPSSPPKTPGGEGMDTTSKSFYSTSSFRDEAAEPGRVLAQQLQDMARSTQARKDPNAEKIHGVNAMNSFSSKDATSAKNPYPTPFKCAGDYCDMQMVPAGALTLDRRASSIHLTKRLFSEAELELLKRDPNFQKMTDLDSSGTDLMQINQRSIELARSERRGIGAISAWEANSSDRATSPNFRSSVRPESGQDKAHFMDPVVKKISNRLDGFPEHMHSYYEQVHVCPTCYNVYRCLDWARGILHKAEQSQQQSLHKTHSSPGRPAPSTRTGSFSTFSVENQMSMSMPSIPTLASLEHGQASEEPSPVEGRIGQRKHRKDKAKTWKSHVGEEPLSSHNPAQRKNELAKLDSYVRNRPVGGGAAHDSYISREKSPVPGKKGRGRPHPSSSSPTVETVTSASSPSSPNHFLPPTASLASSTETASVPQPKANTYRGMILVASQDAQQVDQVRSILQSAFFEVHAVRDGREALNAITENWKSFDAVLLDHEALPLLDIFAVAKGVRAHEKTLRKTASHSTMTLSTVMDADKFLHYRMPLVCWTTATSTSDLNRYMQADMDGCVSKPVEAAALLSTMRAAIPQHLAPLPSASFSSSIDASIAGKYQPRVQKLGLLGEVENSQDSASMALRTMSMAGTTAATHQEGAEHHGMIQLDADTKVPYLVMNGAKYSRLRQHASSTAGSGHPPASSSSGGHTGGASKDRFFNLVVCHDVFDTFERMKILLQPIVQRYQAIQVLVWNYPGQSHTEWRSTQTLNNEYLAACLNEVLGQVGQRGTRDFNTDEPFYLLGYGYGANIASYYMAHYRAPNIRGLIAGNGWAFVDSYLAGIVHDCINIFQSAPPTRPDLPVYFFSRFLFSKDYLAKVSVPLALNIYTAVYNSITITGRIALCQGILKSIDIRPLLRAIDCPIICIHSDQNSFIRPVHVEPFVSQRGGEVRSIYQALQDFRRTCVVWLHGGHEMFQENRKQIVLLLEQVLTGYHEVHELTFPSASSIISATNTMAWKDVHAATTSGQEMSMEDRFTQSVLSLSKSVAHPQQSSSALSGKPTTSGGAANHGSSVHGANASPTRTGTAGRQRERDAHPGQSHHGSTVGSSSASPPHRGGSVSFVEGPSVDSWQHYSQEILDKHHRLLTYDKTKADKAKPDAQSGTTNLNTVALNDVHSYPEVKEYMQWRLKRNKKRLQRLQLAAQSIQCAFRAHLARRLVKTIRELRAAGTIQRVFRGYLGRRRFFHHVRMLWASIYIQKMYRGFLARKFYFYLQVRIAAAANIQRLFRGHLGRELVKRIRAQRHHAACIIQAMFRRFQARRDAWLRRQFRNCAVIIQRNFRGFLGRKRAAAERDKYIFSKSQSQGIEFGRQMLLEHKLHVTRLQSDVTLLTQEKVSAEEQIEALLEEIASFEEGVRVLEKEMHQLSKVEAEAAAFMDEDSKFELREQKMRLDREFGEMLGKIANRKDMLTDIEKRLSAVDKARQGKEEELRTLERKLVVLLEEQQKELSMIKRKQDVRGALLAASHTEMNRVSTAASTAGGTRVGTADLSGGASTASAPGGGGGSWGSGPSLQEKKQAAQLMQSTETLMKFGFMSMSMTYFSSLNMIKALRTVSAQDTVMAALADVHAQRAVNFGNSGGVGGGVGASSSGAGGADVVAGSTASERVMSKLKKGELPGQQRLQVSSWSVDDVAKWLQSLSLGQYCEAFMDSAIDGEFLYDLNDDDLKNTLGIEHRLHRKKILNCIQRLKMAELQTESRLGKLQHMLFQQGAAAAGGGGAAAPGVGGMPDLPVNAGGMAGGGGGGPSFNNVGFPDQTGNAEDDSRMVEGPRIPLSELFSFVRHSKFSHLKEAIDYLPNKPFDKSLIQAQMAPDFGTVYATGYERLAFHINKIDEYGNTLLIYACQNGNTKIAKYLVNKGANPNHQNKQGQTAAHFAISYQFFDLSTWLFEHGASDTLENKYGLTPYDGLNNDGGDGAGDREGMLAIEN